MCDIMENRIRKDRIESAKELITLGKLSTEEIAKALNLPLSTVRELAVSNSEPGKESV